jgi:primase-polymerase (primpol)-like protein
MTSFPKALASLPQWICWRLEPDGKGRDAKVPYDPKLGKKASSTNPDTWATIDMALEALRQYMYTGLGFVFTKQAGIVGVDIDHCIDPATGALNETAAAILEKVI